MNKISASKYGFSAILSTVVGLPIAVKFLFGFMVLDFATGLVAGWMEGKLSSEVGSKGLAKKVLIMLLVGAAHMVDKALVVNLPVSLGTTVAIAYAFMEVVSIVENCAHAGVPIPAVLVQAMAKIKSTARAATKEEIAQLDNCPLGLDDCKDPANCPKAKYCRKAAVLVGKE